MAIRNIGTTLRDHLLENKEFNYTHLVKFEKPTNEEKEGKTTQKGHTYSYISDGAFDIVWDDLSKDAEGNLNGPQTYYASKLTKVGSVSETIEAKGSSLSMTLDAAALGSSLSTPLLTFQVDSVYGNCITTSLGNFIEEGFREGDKILISSVNTAAPNRGKYVIIKNFRDNGTKITYDNGTESGANNTLTPTTSGGDYVITLTSEELNSLILSKGANAYTTYTNREVMIYKAILDVDTNAMIGDPFLLFKGIIQNGAIKENPDKTSSVTWTLASHWGDFSRVSGRLTVDEAHRALDGSGQPDREATVREEYADDLGFAHANQSINVMALYNDIEISYKQVDINGGWPGGKRIREVENVVERRTDLAFNLSPKYLPVIYGVQKTDAIPIFVDTSNTNAAEIFVAYAICEGPVAGLLDIYIDGNSGICVDKADFDLRSGGGDTVDLQCKGRMDRGDALAGYNASTGSANNFSLLGEDFAYYNNFNGMNRGGGRYYASLGQVYQGASGTVTENATGLLHEKTHTITSPIDGHFQFHAGKPFQRANPTLLNKAAANGFKIQNDYFDASNRGKYWGANHRVLDTAYTVGKFTIAPGETSIPEMDFIVRGKGVECFNYDRSFNATNTVSADATNFNIGDTVALRTSSSAYVNSNDAAASSVTITDKWTFIDIDGTILQRFLTDYNKDISTAHYMEKTGGHKWYMAPSIATDDITSTVQSPSKTTITSSAAGSSGGVNVVVDNTALFNQIMAAVLAGIGNESGHLAFSGVGRLDLEAGSFADLVYNSTTGTFTGIASGAGTTGALDSTVEEVFIKDAIILNSANSKPDNFYVGHAITLTRFDSAGVPTIQKRLIKSYKNAGNVALVDTEWNAGYFPDSGDSYTISIGKPDVRVTINPAMQLLDYLTSERYGRGLDLSNDIDLESFKASARACDTRSNVTVATATSNAIAVDDIYRYPASGALLFRGTVESVTTRKVEGTANAFKEVVFKDVIGKLGKKWNSWESFAGNQIIWDNGSLWLMSSSGGQQTTVPDTSGSYQTTSTAFNLTKVSGTGPTSLSLDISKQSANGNPLVKSWVSYGGAQADNGSFVGSGYSLYDSDDIKYWKYIGWDSNDQRNVTRHQMNQTVATSNPIFDNINLMLKQFNGILRYSNGKYQLDIKSRTPVSFDSREILDESDIIGSISLKDGGVKKAHNSISTSIKDPQTKFESRSVSFFNSTYLKQDKNIPKKGNYGMPGITNYFNARFNINQMLDESRYGMTVSFKMAPKGYLLLPGSIIKLNYSRFGWVDKEFRIINLVVNTDCTINVTADEHNNDAYLIKNLSKPSLGGDVQVGVSPNRNAPAPPTNLTATTSGQKGVVTLNWTNSTDFNTNFQATEIYSATVNDRAHASFAKVATVREETFEAAVPNPNETTKFYWIRHVLHIEVPVGRAGGQTITRDLGSAYAPAGATAGVTGTAPEVQDGERGPGRWNIGVSALPSSSSQAQSRWNDGTGDQPTTQVTDDQAWFFTGTESAPSGQKVWIYGGSSWTEQTEVIRGELLVDGTVTTGEIADGTILADNIDQSSAGGRFGEIVAAIGTFTQVDTDVLNANSVIAREVQVFPTGGTPPTISGTTLAGAGIDLKQDGDMYIGNAATNKYMFWDQSEGTMTFRGTLDVDDITGSSAKFATLMAEVATIGTLNTKMLDSDAIVTRDIRVGPSVEVNAGSFVSYTEYYITDLGNTTQAQWNTAAGTSGVVYNLGSIFTSSLGNPGTGTGKARNRTTVAKIAGATLTGAGAHLNADGDFYVGNAATNKYMFWDQSAGTMTLRGELNADDITAGTISANKIDVNNLAALSANLGDVTAGTLKGGNLPDADDAPGTGESGAFFNLGVGKFLVGNPDKYIWWDGTALKLNGVEISDATLANSSGVATETYVNTAISNLLDTAPTTLDTLNELAAALGDDPNFATSVSTSLGNKVSTTSNQALSANANALEISGSVITLTRGDGSTDTVTTPNTNTFRPIHDTPVDGATTTSISSNWAFDNVKTAVPSGAIFTDTNSQRPIHDTPVNGATTTSISSNWAFDNVKTAVPTSAVFTDTNTQRSDEEIRDLAAGIITAGTNVSVVKNDSANTVTISSTNTNTFRPIHDTPVDGATTTSISSNWAFDNVKTAVPTSAVFTDTNTFRPIHDTPVDGATTTSISSNWAFDNVKTAVPASALFTDTNTQRTNEEIRDLAAGIITAGTNISVVKNDAANTVTISSDFTNTQRTDEEIRDVAAAIITAGTNVTVVKNDAADTVTISSTDTDTTYTAGSGITLTGTEFSNADPDQTVTLTGTGLTTISGSYPDFTIDSSAPTSVAQLGGIAASSYVTNVHIQALHLTDALSVSGTTVTLRRANGDTETITTQDTNTHRAIHDSPVDGATTTSISSNWAFDNVKTAVPANALFTDTNTQRAIHDTPVNGATTTSISSNWAFDNVKTAVPSGAVFTDTDTNTFRPIHDSPVNGATTTSISSNWAFDNVKTAVPTSAVFTDTNTFRPIHDTPVNGATTTSISSNWAFDNVKTAVPTSAVFTDTNTVYTHPNHTGDVTSSGDGATTIGSNKVTFAKMQDIATDTFMGRTASGSGDAKALSVSEARTMLNVENGATADQTAAQILAALKTVDVNGTAGINAGTFDGLPGANIPKFYNNAVLTDSASTASFIAELASDYGCFGNNQVTLKVQWSYAGSSDLVTGHATIGTLELAGCTIETWGGTYKHVRITRPNTGAGGHMVVEYNDQSSSYAPGWREIWTSESDGAGSGLDADKLDGQQGTHYLAYTNFTGTPTIPSGNQIIDWTADQGATNIHTGNYLNTNTTNLNLKVTGGSVVNMTAGNTLEFAGTGIASVSRSATKITVAVAPYTATAPLSIVAATKVVSIAQSSTSANGYLSSTDWNSFNSRISNSATQSSNLYIRNGSPTIYLRDTNNISSMIHQNSDVFYVLRADAADDVTWTTYTTADAANGRWPLTMNLTNASHSVAFGSHNITAGGYTVHHSGNTSLLTLGNTATTALAGNTSLLQIGTSSTTALAGNTTIPAGTVTNVQVGNGLSVSSSTTTPTISLGSALLENLGAATFTTIDTDILNANSVIIARDLRGGNLTSAAIPTGTNKGFYLNADGSLMIGNASRHLTMDTSGNVGITNLTVNDITGDVTEVLSFGPINNTLASGNNVGIDLISIPSSAYAYRPVVSASGTIMIQNRDQMEVALQIRENTTTSAVSLGNVTVSTAGVNYGKYGFFNPSVTVVATSAAAFVAATVGDTVTQGSLSYIVASVSVTNSTTQVIGYYNYAGTNFSTGSNLTRGANSPAYETVGTIRVSSEDYNYNHPVPFAVQGGLTRISAESCDVRLLITKYINPSSSEYYKTSVGNFYVYDDCKNVYGTALLVR